MLPALVETYCVHMEAEGRSAKTIAWHRASLGKFLAYLRDANHPENPELWNANTIRAYFVALKHMAKANGEPLSATSVGTYARSLRAFCRWLVREEFLAADPMAKVKQPTSPQLVKPVLSLDECCLERLPDVVPPCNPSGHAAPARLPGRP